MKHTPGPWTHLGALVRKEDRTIATVWGEGLKQSQQGADARLIAAAPDLLEATKQAEIVLQRVVSGIILESAIEYTQTLLDAAIAKATGKENHESLP